MTKRTLIVALFGLNVALLTLLFLTAVSPPTALAQRVAGSGNYLMVTNQVDSDIDAVFLIDLPNRKMHAFLPQSDADGQLAYLGGRDLAADFKAAREKETALPKDKK